jgi:hypothetical protein
MRKIIGREGFMSWLIIDEGMRESMRYRFVSVLKAPAHSRWKERRRTDNDGNERLLCHFIDKELNFPSYGSCSFMC